MRIKKIAIAAAAVVGVVGGGLAAAAWLLPVNVAFGFFGGGDIRARLAEITLADGNLHISVFADELPSARQLALGDDGWVFVGSRKDAVYAVRDADGDGVAEDKRVILSGLDAPRGVAFHDGDLYVGEVPRMLVVRGVTEKLRDKADIKAEVYISGFIPSGHHGARYSKVGPDGMLYVGLGAPCNICQPDEDEISAVVRRYPLGDAPITATDGEVFARGLRNAVGFAWHPQTKVLWITENGRDWLGDDLPEDELNRAPEAGMHFGFPYCHQGDLPDPEFGGARDCDEFARPALLTGAHVANLGMDFTSAGDAIIALHGSWNRSVKVGYSVKRARIVEGEVTSYEDYAEGWLRKDGSVWGRPVDIAVLPDGGVLVSDDYADAIYLIAKKKQQ